MTTKLSSTHRGWIWVQRAWLLAVVLGLAVHTTWVLQPSVKRKTVTLRFQSGHTAQVIFSATQADPEVVYAIKTQWQPLLEQAAGNVKFPIETPYWEHLRAQFFRFARVWGWVWLGIGLAGVVAVRFHVKRYAAGASSVPAN